MKAIQMMTSALPQGQVTIERLCRLARVSRAGYYRLWQAGAPRQHDTAVRDAIQRLVLANGRYRRGYRYIPGECPDLCVRGAVSHRFEPSAR